MINDIIEYIKDLARTETVFGQASAILRHGRPFAVSKNQPDWLRIGKANACYENALKGLAHEGVRYAEGYAIDPIVGFPLAHAWLVNEDNLAIDPTWADNMDAQYFGVVFKSDFVMQLLENGGASAILVDPMVMRRFYRDPDAFATTVG